MSDTVRRVNSFFRFAKKRDVEELCSKVLLSDRQEQIFSMFYLKRKDVCFIADTIGVSPVVIDKELSVIRKKIICEI